MAHDVNQGKRDVAAQVRSALVERISAERFDLWIPQSTRWGFESGSLTLAFETDFHCQLAKRMLGNDLYAASKTVGGAVVETKFQVRTELSNGEPENKRSDVDPKTREVAPVEVVPIEVEPCEPAPKVPQADHQTNGERANIAEMAEQPTPSDITTQPSAGFSSTAGNERLSDEALQRPTCTAMSQPPTEPEKSKTPKIPQRTNGGGDGAWPKFIDGRSNQLAWSAAKLVVAEPGHMNPVLLYGPTGSGKTLLADSITERLRSERRMRRVVRMTSEQFTNDFTEGFRGSGLPMFRRKYRDVEALVLEDIQFFAGKKATLSEVKHTVDTLIRQGKQVVLTADRSLNDLQLLGNELLGQIRGGLTTPIFPLDEETRLALLTRETKMAGVLTPDEVLKTIANRVTGDGRVISGIVKRLTAVARLKDRALDWDDCWSAVHDLIQATQPVVRIVDIERVVCDVFGLEPNSLQTQSKTRSVSQPRMLAMFLARKYTPAAYKEIGDHFGRRRHSTVISAEKTVETWLRENANLRLGKGLSVRDAIRHVESQLQVG